MRFTQILASVGLARMGRPAASSLPGLFISHRTRLDFAWRRSGNVRTESLLPRHPAPRLAPVLFQHLHIGHDHPAVDGLAHVLDGEQRHWESLRISYLACISVSLPSPPSVSSWEKLGQRFTCQSQWSCTQICSNMRCIFPCPSYLPCRLTRSTSQPWTANSGPQGQ